MNTTLSSALIDDVNFSHTMALQREEELRNLLRSIEELNTIFKDISILVIEQGTILDRIDYNIEQAEHNVIKAEEHLIEVYFVHFLDYAFVFLVYLTQILDPRTGKKLKNKTVYDIVVYLCIRIIVSCHCKSIPKDCTLIDFLK